MVIASLGLLMAGQSLSLQFHPLFADGAVLQRGINVPVFGTASPGSFVEVSIGRQKVGATAGPDGRWLVRLAPLRAGEGLTLSAKSGEATVSARDIQVGEVWICSGQSNMEWPEAAADDYTRAQSEATPSVRMFNVEKATAGEPTKEIRGSWLAASASSVGKFSAVGWNFARELNRTLKVPIGMIHTSWGGTPAEAWTSQDALTSSPTFAPIVQKYYDSLKDYPAAMDQYRKAIEEWTSGRRDGSNEGFQRGWMSWEFNDKEWQTVLPTSFENILGKEFDGVGWYRKSVSLPDAWYGKELKLELGPIDDFDVTYVNGVRVGATDATVERSWERPRSYRIAPGIVRRGVNVIAIRAVDTSGGGGLMGSASAVRIGLADGSAWLPLDVDWKFQIERVIDRNKPGPSRPTGPSDPNSPSTLFNGMLSPIIPYGIKGAIWYQGESNAGRAYRYRELFPLMIQNWRQKWGQGNFPFYWVSLANFLPRDAEPVESAWAELREAQDMTLKLPNTGQALAIDIGEAKDIHPRNKREVGRRLAIIALGKTYNQPILYASPRYVTSTVRGDRIVVAFANGALRTSDGQAPRGFAIAGEDRNFVWADARIEGSNVIVSSPKVPNPVAVRYGWANNPDVNVINAQGLPAVPFRTDTWPGVTVNNR